MKFDAFGVWTNEKSLVLVLTIFSLFFLQPFKKLKFEQSGPRLKTPSEINPPLQGYLPIIKNLSSLENCTSEEESCGERDTTGSELHFNNGKNCPKPKSVTNFIGEIEEIIEVHDTRSVMAKCFF